MSTARLKLCPFCGGRAEVKSMPLSRGGIGDRIDRYYVRCQSCGVEGPGSYDSPALAVEGWNTRYTEPEQEPAEQSFDFPPGNIWDWPGHEPQMRLMRGALSSGGTD